MDEYKAFNIYPTILILADPRGYILDLIKKLDNKGLDVIIMSNHKSDWQEQLVAQKHTLYFKNNYKNISNIAVDYIICDLSTSDEDSSLISDYLNQLKFAKKVSEEKNAKIIFLFKYVNKSKDLQKITSLSDEILHDKKLLAGCIFLGDIFPWRLFNRGFYYPLAFEEAADLILRILFSLKAYGHKIAIIGNLVIIPGKEDGFRGNPALLARGGRHNTAGVDEVIIAEKDIGNVVIEEYNNKFDNNLPAESLLKQNKINKIYLPRKQSITVDANKKRRFFRKLIITTTILLIALLIPFITVGLNLLFLKTAEKSFINSDLARSQNLMESVVVTSGLTKKYFLLLSKIPFSKNFAGYFSDLTTITLREAGIGIKIIEVNEKLVKFSDLLTNDESYDINFISNELSLDLMSLYEALGFLESEIEGTRPSIRYLSSLNYVNYDINRLQHISLVLSRIFKEVPEIFGSENPSKYLILVLNDLYSRPTGGRIDAFVVLTFSGGKLVEWKAYDVAFADSKLAGFVEPPKPLEKHFEVKNWYLRDSNWDPDFAISAAKAEWFLDKELDIDLKGVLSVNTSFIESLLERFTKPELKDSNINVDYLNSILNLKNQDYPKPDPDQKIVNFLEKFIKDILSLDYKRKVFITKRVMQSLEDKDILLFFHNNNAQKSISEVGWGLSLKSENCKDNCYSDNIMVVESSLVPGNTMIKREANLTISLEQGLIKKNLTYFLDNKSNEDYKVYLRVFTPVESGFGPVAVVDKIKKSNIEAEVFGVHGNKAAGVYINVTAKTTTALIFSWEGKSELNFQEPGKYVLSIIRQPGIPVYPVAIKVNVPEKLHPSTLPELNLTDEGDLKYNTQASQDINLRLFW